MKVGLGRRIWARLLLLAALLLAPAAALAQAAPPPPTPQNVDERGINLTTGTPIFSATDLAIGPEDHRGLRFTRQWTQYAWRIADVPTLSGSTSDPVVSFGGQSVPFTGSTSSYAPVFQDGSTLVWNGSKYIFTGSDGMVIEFGLGGYGTQTYQANLGLGAKVTFPDGVVWTYHFNTGTYVLYQQVCYVTPAGYECYTTPVASFPVARVSSVTSSTGYQMKLGYAGNNLQADGPDAWTSLASAKAINNAVEYCDPVATSCSLSNPWPQVTYSGGNVTDPEGRTTTYTVSAGLITGISQPGASADTVSIAYNANAKVSGVTVNGATWTYSYAAPMLSTTITDPFSQTRTVNYDSAGKVTSAVAGGQTTQYEYCGASETNCPPGLLKKVTAPEQNYVTYAYDARGNVTSTTASPKPSVGGSAIVTSAAYPSTCTNQKTCNKPTSTTDARGQVTNYDWNTTHGGLNYVRAPTDAGGVRPETRISYSSVSARYLTAPGTYSNGAAMYAPAAISTCRTATSGNPASCVGSAEETVTAVAYPSAVPNNAQPSSVTTKAGNNTLVATTAVTYDNYGRVLTADGPLSGTADTSRIRYNLAGQVIGRISPDPDANWAGKHRAVRYSYNNRGQLYLTESGTVNDLSDSAWAAFSPLDNTLVEFDGYFRPVRQKVRGGTTDYQIIDTVYDSASRVQCSIVRMDPAQWSTVASSCNPPQANDRVTYNHYDSLSRVWKVTTGYGTSVAADDQIATFTNNGRLLTLTDAEANRTTYEYDGHDRLVKTFFPVTTKGANSSSTTDYEQVGYDANSNVTSFRTRAGYTMTYTYDNLNRLSYKTMPYHPTLPGEQRRPVEYGYDLHGNLLAAGFDGTSGQQAVLFSYDALGRRTSETQVMDGSRTISHQYDAAGNRTRLTYPDGNYVNYNRHGSGALNYSDLNGSSPLVHGAFDTASRIEARYRWNTSAASWLPGVTGFGYDAVSRLSLISIDPAGATYDSPTYFSYNPAGQISSQSRSNDLYAWNGQATVTRNYTADGLNRYTAVSGLSGLTYDTNGNLTQIIGTNQSAQTVTDGYVYDIENRLVTNTSTVTGGSTTTATLRYDPLGRLYEVTGASGTRRFLYDGDELVAEYGASGTLLRRYVHGESAGDDPLVWFEGSSVADSARRYLYADERGSIVAVTNSSGSVLNLNTYDEYGIPGSTNAGAFQYTGQVWLPELGMYHYKARMYSPTLGRFMQTDPIGYGDGMNMYAYVGNDAVNFVDPTGLAGWYTGPGGKWCRDWTTWAEDAQGNRSGVNPGTTCFGGFGGGSGSPWNGGAPGFDTGLPTPEYMCENREAWMGVAPLELLCDGPRPSPSPEPEPQNTNPCPPPQSTAGKIADWAEWVGTGADTVAVTAAVLGVATAPTGAGAVVFGGTAIVAGAVGRAASVVSIAANLIEGDKWGALKSGGAFVGGAAAGVATKAFVGGAFASRRMFGNLSVPQRRITKVAAEGAGGANGLVINGIGC